MVTIDLFIDGDGVLRRLDVSGELSEPADADGTSQDGQAESWSRPCSTISGSDITIEAPADAVDVGADFDVDIDDLGRPRRLTVGSKPIHRQPDPGRSPPR